MKNVISEKYFGEGVAVLDLLHPAAELPNQVFNNHIITLYQSPLTSAFTFKGKETKENFAIGDVGIYPADVYEFVKTFNNVKKIHLHISPQMLADKVFDNLGNKDFELKIVFKAQDNFLKETILLLHKELNQENVDHLFTDSLLTTLVMYLYKNYSQHLYWSIVKGRITQNDIYKIRNYVLDNISEKIMLKDLASVVNLSEFHFARLFKASTGSSPYLFARQTKIDYAKQLIKTKLSLSEVAFLTGFNDESHFTKVFKQMVGVKPSVYKNSK